MILCGDKSAGTVDRARASTGTPPPPLGRKQAEGGEGWSGSRIVVYVTIDDGA